MLAQSCSNVAVDPQTFSRRHVHDCRKLDYTCGQIFNSLGALSPFCMSRALMRECLCFAKYLNLCWLWLLESAMSFGHTIAERQFVSLMRVETKCVKYKFFIWAHDCQTPVRCVVCRLRAWMRECLCFAKYLSLCWLWLLESAVSFGHTIAERQFDALCV